MGWRLDWMTVVVFSSLNDSTIHAQLWAEGYWLSWQAVGAVSFCLYENPALKQKSFTLQMSSVFPFQVL